MLSLAPQYMNKLLKCKRCLQITSSSPQSHVTYKNCYTCFCSNPNCSEFWFICSQHNIRFSSSKISRMRSHFLNVTHCDNNINTSQSTTCTTAITKFATNIINNNLQSELNVDDSYDFDDLSYESSNHEGSIDLSESPSSPKRLKIVGNVDNDSATDTSTEYILPYRTQQFFENEKKLVGSGKRGLVARAFCQDQDIHSLANEEETNLHLKITHFCSKITQDLQKDFASILSSILSTGTFQNTRPPMSYNDITTFYTSSKHSIYKNIPSPDVFLTDNHACVTIESIVSHMLSFGVNLNSLEADTSFEDSPLRYQSIETTKEVEDIINNINRSHNDINSLKPMILYIILWSDDFEANNTRKNRNSTWIKTVTICPPKEYNTSTLYTYPIAIGRKGQSHDIVNNLFNQEIKRLSSCTYRYCQKYKRNYPVIIAPLCVSADRPERSSLNSILSHNGSSTKRWMYSELIPRPKLPSCSRCFSIRCCRLDSEIELASDSRVCKRCCDWNMDNQNNCAKFFPPTNYPGKKHPESPVAPSHRDISKPFEKMVPIRVSYDILTKGMKFAFWNYLHSTWNKSETQTYFRLIGISTSYFQKVIEFADHQKQYLPVSSNILDTIPLPSMWASIFRLEQSIDTPMHLLFQGVTKTIIEQSKEYFKHHSLWSKFGKHTNTFLEDISNSHVDFCKAESFNGGTDYTTGGWIAETYLGYARLSTIIYSYASESLPSTTLALNEFQCMMQSFSCLVSRLMTTENVALSDIEDYIKLFLSCCTKYHITLYGSSSKGNPFWNSPNFLSLLNLPKQISQFGTMRLHWEGIHERFIQHIKPHLKNMRTSSTYLEKKLDDIHKCNVLNNLLLNPSESKKKYQRYQGTRHYLSRSLITETIEAGSMFIGIVYQHNEDENIYSVLIGNKNLFIISQIHFLDEDGYHQNNLWFAPIDVRMETTINVSVNLVDIDSIMFIPVKTFQDNKVRYTVIGKDWKVRSRNNEYLLPTVSVHRLRELYR